MLMALLISISIVCTSCGNEKCTTNVDSNVIIDKNEMSKDENFVNESSMNAEELIEASDEILNAELADGKIQIDNNIFKCDGNSTVGDIMNILSTTSDDYHVEDDSIVDLDDCGDPEGSSIIFVMNNNIEEQAFMTLYVSDDFTTVENPTYGEFVVDNISSNEGLRKCEYYANGFCGGYEITEEELIKYFEKQGLKKGESYPRYKNTYAKSDTADGKALYVAYVVPNSGKDIILEYNFKFKSADILDYCSFSLQHYSE